MKKLVFICAAIAFCTATTTAQTTEGLLPNGKSIPVRITSAIGSNTKKGPEPTAIVDADIRDDRGEHLLIRRGTPVEIAADIRKARGVGKGALIHLDFLSTTAVDGQKIRLQGNWSKEGASKKGAALGVGLGVGLTVCWPCLFCLCIKGEKVTVPENTIVNNVVANDSYRIRTE